MEEVNNNNSSPVKESLSQKNVIPQNESKPQLQTKKTKRVNNSREKDLSKEILYFSINQDSK